MYTVNKSTVVKIHEGESEFAVLDGMVTYPRADMEFSADCPAEYIQMIQRARMKGWVKLVAYVTEEEYTWNQLKNTAS
jgi:hypothetical protein